MSNLYRGPAIDASYQVSVHLAKRFRRRRFLKICQSETRIACGGCLLIDRDKISNLQRGPSIDASYQVSVHLAKRFQRRRLKCEKLTDDGRQTPCDGKSSHSLWQGELKISTSHTMRYSHVCKGMIQNFNVLVNRPIMNFNVIILTQTATNRNISSLIHMLMLHNKNVPMFNLLSSRETYTILLDQVQVLYGVQCHFQQYFSYINQLYWWRKSEYPEKTSDLSMPLTNCLSILLEKITSQNAILLNTVKPVDVVTSIKQSPVLKGHLLSYRRKLHMN